MLESARDDLRARAEHAEADGERARGAEEAAQAERGRLRAAAADFLAACEQALDEPARRLIEGAAASLRAATGNQPPPAAPRRGRSNRTT